ncbi:GDSL-type esterase/lipase family protein [Melioribacter sp. Ez-97]|uniref:GDSL-type esterase/lipase family protein n=1 Tax=Melioribacter sp. Ez-97 TaxID=3423434 RepID=UPI003ED9C013
MKKIFFPVILTLALSSTAPVFGQSDSTPQFKKNPNYERMNSLFDIYKTKQADIVFLGNSLTAGVDWSELLGRCNAVGRGIPSDLLPGFLERLDDIIRLKPKIVFIMGGINDVYNWTPVDEIYFNYLKIISRLQSKNIIPVITSVTYAARNYAKDWGGTPEVNAGRNREIDKLNKMLKNYALRNNIDYIDLNELMANADGFINEKYTWDGLHYNAEGYKIWAAEIEKILSKHKL